MKYLIIYLVMIISVACQDRKSPSNITYYRNNCNDLDSIWSYYLSNKQKLTPSFISHVEQRLFFTGKEKDAEKLLDYSLRYIRNNSDKKFEIYNNLNHAYFYLWKQKFDLCFQEIKKLNNVQYRDTTFELASDQLLGSYWYLKGEVDSANKYFKKGYVYALSNKREDYIQTFSLNLGAIAYSQNLIGTAIYYFTKAYELNLKNKSPNLMLNNNLAAALMTQKKYKEAEKLLLNDTLNLKINNTEYYGITSKLNFVSLKQDQNQWFPSGQIIYDLNESKIPATFYLNWLFLKMRQLEHDNPVFAKDFFIKYSTQFLSNQDYFLYKMGDLFVRQVTQFPHVYSCFLDPNYFSLKNIANMKFRSQYFYFQILSEFEKLKGNFKIATQYERQASTALVKDYSLSDSLKIEDISMNMSLIQLSMKLEESEQSLLQKEKQLMKSWFGILSLLIIILIFIFLGYYILKKKVQHVKMSQELLESKSREAHYLEEEKRLNSKIHAMSRVIIQKSKSMAETIKRGPYFNSPEIKSIQKELENMGRIEALVSNEDKVQIIERDFEFLWSKYKILDELNESQKRILVLSIEQFKPKEIAMSLNLSYAYVRNVQTLLRKQLFELGFSDFAQLKA